MTVSGLTMTSADFQQALDSYAQEDTGRDGQQPVRTWQT